MPLGEEGSGLFYSRGINVYAHHPATGFGKGEQIASLSTAHFQHFIGDVSDDFLYVGDIIVLAGLCTVHQSSFPGRYVVSACSLFLLEFDLSI